MFIPKVSFSGREDNSCRRSFFALIASAFAAIILLSSSVVYAQGNLLITPRRVVFEGNKRSIDLNLANVGNDTATYAVSVIQIRMNDDGGFETIIQPDPGQLFADRFIRFFPRSVTLGPNESQVVKVQIIRTGELTPGEYRSHFYFRAVPKPRPLGENEAEPRDSTTISVRLTPVFGITIPVIIRVGDTNTKVTLSNLGLEYANDTIPRISMTFNRTGNMSIYGDVTVDHVSLQGKVTRVGIANGVAVYTPNQMRRFILNLSIPRGFDMKSGKLLVTYSAPSDIKPEKYANTELEIK